jgi:hypothetical protein
MSNKKARYQNSGLFYWGLLLLNRYIIILAGKKIHTIRTGHKSLQDRELHLHLDRF